MLYVSVVKQDVYKFTIYFIGFQEKGLSFQIHGEDEWKLFHL